MIIDDGARAALPARIALVAVAALLLLRVATLAEGLRAPLQAESHADLPGIAAPQMPAAAALLDAIRRANLFGTTAVDGAVIPSSLQLVLTGTFAYADPQIGYAVLGEKPDRAVLRRVGDEVFPGATLKQVFADHVVLERAGVLESLAITRQDLSGSSSAAVLAALMPEPEPEIAPGQEFQQFRQPITPNTGILVGSPPVARNGN